MRLAVTPLFGTTPHFEYFTLNVALCKIDSFIVATPNPTTYYYNINNPPTSTNIPLPFISASPSTCTNGFLGNGLDYKLQVTGSTIQPPFLTKATDKFILSTSDPAKRGTWSVDLVIYPNSTSSTAQPIVRTYTLILSACNLANPQFQNTVSQITYSVGTGQQTFNPMFTSLYQADCFYTLSLTQAQMAAGTFNSTIVSQFAPTTGVMSILTADASLVGTSIQFTIKAT